MVQVQSFVMDNGRDTPQKHLARQYTRVGQDKRVGNRKRLNNQRAILTQNGDHLFCVKIRKRPLTSQARGAKQSLPEPSFTSPPITEEDLQCLQMSNRSKNPDIKPLTVVETKLATTEPSNITDDNSSSSSDSDSCSSSDEDVHVQVHTSILVINKKSHIIHAASQISSNSMTRSRFRIRDKCFEVTCGSSITGVPVDIIDSIHTFHQNS